VLPMDDVTLSGAVTAAMTVLCRRSFHVHVVVVIVVIVVIIITATAAYIARNWKYKSCSLLAESTRHRPLTCFRAS